MKKLSCLIGAVVLIVSFTGCKDKAADSKTQISQFDSFKISKGTNAAHWLSQSKQRGRERENFFTEKDVRFIDSVGFDHIRIPIDEEQMWDESGKRNEEAFNLLNNGLKWCNDAGLRVIVDLHILRSHHFNEGDKPLWTVPAEQDKFIMLWKDLSAFLSKWPDGMVAYEPMNEPVADDHEQWNILLGRLIDSVRTWEPSRVLVLGSNRWQSADTFDKFRVPVNDTNIVLSFHFYEPFFLTHYQASWTNLKDFKGEVNYPGQIVLNSKKPEHMKVYNRDTLLYMMRKPLRMADSLNLPLYCGEFGVYEDFFPEAKLAWYRDMVSIFQEHEIAYANWNYKSGAFGIVDEKMVPDVPILEILTSSK